MNEASEIEFTGKIPPEVTIANENRRGKTLLMFALLHIENRDKRLAYKIKKHLGIAHVGITK